jgi:hypothetical protein
LEGIRVNLSEDIPTSSGSAKGRGQLVLDAVRLIDYPPHCLNLNHSIHRVWVYYILVDPDHLA